MVSTLWERVCCTIARRRQCERLARTPLLFVLPDAGCDAAGVAAFGRMVIGFTFTNAPSNVVFLSLQCLLKCNDCGPIIFVCALINTQLTQLTRHPLPAAAAKYLITRTILRYPGVCVLHQCDTPFLRLAREMRYVIVVASSLLDEALHGIGPFSLLCVLRLAPGRFRCCGSAALAMKQRTK